MKQHSATRLAWQITKHEPFTFWVGWITFVIFFTLPAANGFLLGRGFDALGDGDTTAVYWFAVVLAATEAVRMAVIHFAAITWTKAWVHMQTLVRGNLLQAQMASGGPEAGQPVGSSGEAITHFREDADDVGQLIDGIVDVSGGLLFSVIAGFVLGFADARAAAVLVLPLIGVVLVTRLLDGRIKAYRAADRAAAAAVTGLVGDVMAAATTVKVNGAAGNLLDRLKVLVDRRGVTAVRDRVLDEGVLAFSHGAADIGFGLIIVVSAGAIASGSFAVGTLALFAAYLGWLSFLPRMVGRVLARRKQAAIAFERMRVLVADEDAQNTVRPRSLPLEARQRPVRPDAVRPDRVRLESLEVIDLVARYRSGRRGVTNEVGPVSFRADRGTFTVVTGPVGSGKSTLLRAMLGLAWRAEVTGEVRWNGVPIVDRGAFLVPPNVAFLPQVPQLISDSVVDNVSLGPMERRRIDEALRVAEIADDVAAMPDAGDTLIGPRGLRLSGGQRQRLATARALVHGPELIVLDDLSSAVDVETELRLWENLAAAGLTVIAVSHRAVAFERADQIIRLA